MELELRLREAVAEEDPGNGFTARVMAAVDSVKVVDIRSRQRSRIILLGVALCVGAAAAMLVAQLTPRDNALRVEVAQRGAAARPVPLSEGAAETTLPTAIEQPSTETTPMEVPVEEVARAEVSQQTPVTVPQKDRLGRITLLVMPVVDRSGAPGAKDAAEAFRGQLVRDFRGLNDLVVLDTIVDPAAGAAPADFRLMVSSLEWRRPQGMLEVISSTGARTVSGTPYASDSDRPNLPGLGNQYWPVEARIEELKPPGFPRGEARDVTVMTFLDANGVRQPETGTGCSAAGGSLLRLRGGTEFMQWMVRTCGNSTALASGLAEVMRQQNAPVPVDQTPARPAATSTIALRPGEIRRPLPEGMRIYRELTGLADAVERAATERDAADDISSQLLLRRFNIGDQDLVKLDKYLRSATRSDRDNQAQLLAEICSRKADFHTLDEFGIALNEFNRKAELHQENLGLEAAAELGAELFSKVSQPDRGQRPREQTNADFPALFKAQNRDLQTEIARFCSQAR